MKEKQVESWLNSQSRIPYELDFYTPFKELAIKTRSKPQIGQDYKIAPSASTDGSVSSDRSRRDAIERSSPDSSHMYRRRPRHKTRNEYYRYKAKQQTKHKRRRATGEKQISRGRCGRKHSNTVDRFQAHNIASERLTLKRKAGFLEHGRASAPKRCIGVPDLAFPEKMFLNLGREWARRRESKPVDGTQRPGRRAIHDAEYDKEEYAGPDPRPLKTSEIFGDTRSSEQESVDGVSQDYQTPCKRPRLDFKSSTKPQNLPNCKNFLGFGKSGPTAQRQMPSTERRVRMSSDMIAAETSSSPIAMKIKAQPQPASPDTTSVDPRARHSPISNFKFARNQLGKLRTERDVEHEVGKTVEARRQKEILALLHRLYDQKILDRTHQQEACISDEHPSEQANQGDGVELEMGPDKRQVTPLTTQVKREVREFLEAPNQHDLTLKLSELLRNLNESSKTVESASSNGRASKPGREIHPGSDERPWSPQAENLKSSGEQDDAIKATKEASHDKTSGNFHTNETQDSSAGHTNDESCLVDTLPAIGMSRLNPRASGLCGQPPPSARAPPELPFYIFQAQSSVERYDSASKPSSWNNNVSLHCDLYHDSTTRSSGGLTDEYATTSKPMASRSLWQRIRTAQGARSVSINQTTNNSRAVNSNHYVLCRSPLPTRTLSQRGHTANAIEGKWADVDLPHDHVTHPSTPSAITGQGGSKLSDVFSSNEVADDSWTSGLGSALPDSSELIHGFWKPHILY